ncbi:MAG: flagellar hook-associated protein FlgK [Acidobacteriaceae bacterium]
MGSINTGFNIATGALEADQAALNVVANNVANANTTGYTREVPNFQTADSVVIGSAIYGDGVTMTGGVSQRNPVLQQSLDQQTQAESASAARLTALNQVQSIFSSATSAGSNASTTGGTVGISQDMASFFNAMSALEAGPSDTALRQQVLSSAGNLATDFNSASQQLTSEQLTLNQQSGSLLDSINGLTANIAQLNAQIGSLGTSGDAGSLQDARATDIAKLGALIGVNQIQTENNGLTLTTTSGALLVSGSQSFALSTGSVSGMTHFFDANGNDITSGLMSGGGQLGGLLTVRDQDIPQMQSSLDTLAYSLGSAINAQNAAGTDANGNPGGAIFSLPAISAGAAAQISVVMTNPSLIAAAAAGDGSQNGSNAQAMAGIASQSIAGGVTPGNYYSDFVTSLGSLVSEVHSQNAAQQASVTQLTNQVGAISGVSLNEEAASMQTLEQAYQAASKVFTIISNVELAALNLGVGTTYA